MPDFGNLEQDVEKEGSSHPQQSGEAVKKADQAADSVLGGKDYGMVDKGEDELEGRLGGGGSQTPGQPPDK